MTWIAFIGIAFVIIVIAVIILWCTTVVVDEDCPKD